LCVDQFIPSAIRLVPHTEDLPVPVQPSTHTDADFTTDLQSNEFHRITQE